MTGNVETSERNLTTVFGLPFDNVSIQDSVSLIETSIAQRGRCVLSTPNLNFVIQAHQSKDFYLSVLESNLVVADGMPIIWVAKILGLPLSGRVAGSCLFEALGRKRRSRPIRVFFFGGQDNAAEQAANNLKNVSVGMEACGFHNPGMGSVESMSDMETIDTINRADADFLVVALGAKKGQQWIMHNRARLKVPVISHLGAVINFVAGGIRRAPPSWQKYGVEWLWRIAQEPQLVRRYLIDGLHFTYLLCCKVVPLAIYQRVLGLAAADKAALKVSTNQIDNCLELRITGSAVASNSRLLKDNCEKALHRPCTILKHVRIDCSGLDYIDSAALAVLLMFKLRLCQQGLSLTLFDLSPRIVTLLSLHGVQGFLLDGR